MHPEHRSIGELAYLLWQARGCPQGTAHEDWLEAERRLREAQAAARSDTDGTASAEAEPQARVIQESLVVESRVVDDSLRDTFPASDPPASHRPDEPPANADDKWKAAGAARKKRPRTRAQQSKSDPTKPNNDARR